MNTRICFILAALLLGSCALAAASGCGSSAAQDNEATANQEGQQEQQHKEHPPNRLANETSPYLLLHAHNPVDWYPWGDEALQKAKQENKLIFLSIGYSSCHWCHVMEKESFMDEEIAAYLNEHFVCIKVDREERPDVDEIYMTSLQMYNQLLQRRAGGGWPLSMFLTPQGLPLTGGTYFPPRSKEGFAMPGFIDVIEQIQTAWAEDNDRAIKQGELIAEIVKEQLDNTAAEVLNPLTPGVPQEVLDSLAFNFDPEYGGFNYSPVNPRVPKFPSPSNFLFLLDVIRQAHAEDASEEAKSRADEAKNMLLVTLNHMADGGIYDQLGGGFHRYSVDRFWYVPHFEKMLYDNGQLATIYAEVFAITGEERYKRIVDETLAFVLREMTHEDGGFFSALDADSEGEEGTFYIWTKEEVEELLADMDLPLFREVYSLDGEPNFEGSHYVLQFSTPLAEIAESKELSVAELWQKLRPMNDKLMQARDKRERPLLDTKVLTAWNGLMIRGFADAGRLLENQDYIAAAEKAANFLLANVKTEEGRLLRTWSAGEAKLNAYLDDYAFFVDGLIALHKATGDNRWLDEAKALTDKQIELFADANRGGFYFTSEDHEALIARTKGGADNVRPGGNTVTAGNLLYLADQLDEPSYLDRTLSTLQANGRTFAVAPGALPRMAVVLRELAARGHIKQPAPPEDQQADGVDDGVDDGTDNDVDDQSGDGGDGQ